MLLDRHGLRYDTRYEQAQDYELWTRLLRVADGDNMPEALVFRRVHPGQTSKRLRRRSALVPAARSRCVRSRRSRRSCRAEAAELAWLVGAGEPVPESAPEAVEAYLTLYERFRAQRRRRRHLSAVRVVASRRVMRAALGAQAGERVPHCCGVRSTVDPRATASRRARSVTTPRRRA